MTVLRWVQWCAACNWEQPALPLVKFLGESIEPDRDVVAALAGVEIPPPETWCPNCGSRPLLFIDKEAALA